MRTEIMQDALPEPYFFCQNIHCRQKPQTADYIWWVDGKWKCRGCIAFGPVATLPRLNEFLNNRGDSK